MRDYYKELDLEPGKDYNAADMKKAWRKKCLENHPDRGGDKGKFVAVTHAYKMLTDPSYRRQEAEKKPDLSGDLAIRLQVPIGFEDWFFGRAFTVTYNRIEITPGGKVIPKKEQEIVSIRLDAATMSPGQPIIFEGHGLRMGDKLGDAHVTLCPQAHPRFKVEGINVVTEENLPLDTLLRGGEVEVQTVYGIKTVKVPPGTKPGEQLPISGCGFRKKGDHIVIVHPIFPTKDQLRKEKAWKALDINWENHEKENEDAKLEREFEKLRLDSFFTTGFGRSHGTTTGG